MLPIISHKLPFEILFCSATFSLQCRIQGWDGAGDDRGDWSSPKKIEENCVYLAVEVTLWIKHFQAQN